MGPPDVAPVTGGSPAARARNAVRMGSGEAEDRAAAGFGKPLREVRHPNRVGPPRRQVLHQVRILAKRMARKGGRRLTLASPNQQVMGGQHIKQGVAAPFDARADELLFQQLVAFFSAHPRVLFP